MSEIQELKEKLKNLKVLFVDDDEQIRVGTSIFLNKFFNNVVISDNGENGLAIFKETLDFDIIITDIQMPKMDGITMMEKIKEIKPDIFTIFITASRGKLNLSEGLYDLYITKPISYEDVKLIMLEASKI